MLRLAFAIVTWAATQSCVSPPPALLDGPGPLTPGEVDAVLEAASKVIVGKSFMSYGGFGGGTFTVGEGPRVRSAYYGDRATEWTGTAARRCDGTPMDGELSLEWAMDRSGWTATATADNQPRLLDAMFELWSVEIELVEDAGFREVDGIRLRGLRYPFQPHQGAQFEASSQSIWFDPRTRLPVRYEIEIRSPEPMDYGYFLAYAPGWAGGPDPTAERPDCIPPFTFPR